jgi:hypothetical protein
MNKVATPMRNTLSFDAPSMKMNMRRSSLIMSSWTLSRRMWRMMTLFGSSIRSSDTKVLSSQVIPNIKVHVSMFILNGKMGR